MISDNKLQESRDSLDGKSARDVASALGCRVARDMTRLLNEDEKGEHNLRTLGESQGCTSNTKNISNIGNDYGSQEREGVT